eukprot:gene28965-34956_t
MEVMEIGSDSAKLMKSGGDMTRDFEAGDVIPCTNYKPTSSKKAETHPHHRKYSVFVEPSAEISGSVLSLMNSTVGSGMLGLPYAFSKSGWVLGTIFMVLSAICTIFGLDLLSACAFMVPQPPHLFDVADLALPNFAGIVDVAVAILSLGGTTAYLMIIGDLMPLVIEEFGGQQWWQQRTVWVCIGFAIVAPLSCFRTLKALEYTAALSIAFTLFITLVVALFSCQIDSLDPCADTDDCVGDKTNVSTTYATLRTLPIFIFAFACHTNVFPIAAELKGSNQERMDWVIFVSMGCIFAIYMVLAVAGYQTYGDKVDPNILISYPPCCYPLSINPGRKVILAVMAHLDPDDIEISEKTLLLRFAVVTVVFLIVTLVIALSVTDISIVLSVAGSTGSTIVAFILPGFAYYEFTKNEEPSWKRFGALALGYLGLIIMPVCLAFVFV